MREVIREEGRRREVKGRAGVGMLREDKSYKGAGGGGKLWRAGGGRL